MFPSSTQSKTSLITHSWPVSAGTCAHIGSFLIRVDHVTTAVTPGTNVFIFFPCMAWPMRVHLWFVAVRWACSQWAVHYRGIGPSRFTHLLWQAALLLAVILLWKFLAPELNTFRIRLVMFDYCNRETGIAVNSRCFLYFKFRFCWVCL